MVSRYWVRHPGLCTRCQTALERGAGECGRCRTRADAAITFAAPAGHLRDLATVDSGSGNQGFAKRVTQLSSAERHLLRLASVFGHSFSATVLDRILQRRSVPLSLDEALPHLVQQNILIRRPGAGQQDEWVFRFQLMPVIIYRALSANERRALHALAAEYFEAHLSESGLRATEERLVVEQLAHHYERADQGDLALANRLKAAQLAANRYDFESVLFHCARAKMLIERTPGAWSRRLQMHELLADVYLLQNRLEEARAEYRTAIEISNLPQLREGRHAVELHRKMANLEGRLGNRREVRQWLNSAMVLLTFDAGSRESAEAARLYSEAGWHCFQLGDRSKAQGFYEQALPLLPEQAYARERASLCNRMARLHWTHGEVSSAENLARDSLRLAGTADDLAGIAAACLTLATLMYYRGQWEEALDLAGRALILGQTIGARDSECEARLILATLFLGRGEWELALTESRQGLEIAESSTFPRLKSLAYRCLAETHRQRGAVREACLLLLQALENAHQLQEPWEEIPCHVQYAEILLSLGRLRDAYDEAQQALVTASEIQLPLVQASARRILGDYYLALGDGPSAKAQYRYALRAYTRLELPYETARVELALAQLYQTSEAIGKAHSFNLQARERLASLGATPCEERAPVSPGGLALFPVDRATPAMNDYQMTGY